MGRLIDADELYNNYETQYRTTQGVAHKAFDVALTILCNAPTVDAVPVVRCKFCSKSDVTDTGKRFCSAPLGTLGSAPVKDDDFCSYGVKMDEERT
jgi:hypothetical protein